MNDRIVELCSAANSVEAAAICAALEDEGIHARVLGDVLGNAVGILPCGEATAPRVWVRLSDAVRAQEVLNRRLEERSLLDSGWSNNRAGQVDNLSYDEPKEEVPASDVSFRFLNQGWYIIGVICFLAGGYWAWHNRLMLSEYSATAAGRWVGDDLIDSKLVHAPGGGVPYSQPQKVVFVIRPQFVFFVGGEKYYAWGKERDWSPGQATKIATDDVVICYVPHQPQKNIVGPISPPWAITTFAVVVGAMFMFIGFKFR